MPDWKRASEVPEVSMVFAGVSVGAAATGPTQAAPETRRSSSKLKPAVQRDVAVANEVPSPELPSAKAETSPAEPSSPVDHAATATQGAAKPLVNGEAAAPTSLSSALSPSHAPPEAEPVDGPRANAPTPDASGGAAASAIDPFSRLGPAAPAAIGEATQFFITKAGVHKRNPPWKIALFVLGAAGIAAGLGSILQTLNIVPKVTRTTDDGREVQESFFSSGGMSGLKEILSGEAQRRKSEADRQRKLREAAARSPPASLAEHDTSEVGSPRPTKDKDLLALYKADALPTRGPRIRKGEESGGAQPNAAGLSMESAMKVVADKSKAFEQCVENALHRNPNLAVGKITIFLVVGPSGAVKSARVEPPKHESSDWAQCMVAAGKRIVFPSSDGETELEIPFKVGVAVVP